MMPVLETGRLVLRPLVADDCAFILRHLNEPSFIANIADKGVRSEADALRYLQNGPLSQYEAFGLGLMCVTLRGTGEPVGLCGLLRRDGLEEPDLGYSLGAPFHGQGYAMEAAEAVLEDGYSRLGLTTTLAIVSPTNAASVAVLQRLGFDYGHTASDWPGGPVEVYRLDAEAQRSTVFFYGLFMDHRRLRQQGLAPEVLGLGYAAGHGLRLGRRATLVPDPQARSYGVVMRLSRRELRSLYGQQGLEAYGPASLVVTLGDARQYGCLAYLCAADGRPADPAYAADLAQALAEAGAPAAAIAPVKRLGEDRGPAA